MPRPVISLSVVSRRVRTHLNPQELSELMQRLLTAKFPPQAQLLVGLVRPNHTESGVCQGSDGSLEAGAAGPEAGRQLVELGGTGRSRSMATL